MPKGYFGWLIKGDSREERGFAATPAAAWEAAGKRAPGHFTNQHGLISISVNGESISVSRANYQKKISSLVAQHG